MRRGACLISGTLMLALGMAGSAGAGQDETGLYGGHEGSLANRRAAFRDAERHLGTVRLPAAATFVRKLRRLQLQELEGADNHAAAGDVWRVPGTIASVFRCVRRHPPVGAGLFSEGYGGTPGG